jgi:uncharacterized repeat protein (TIGR02059 family)
MRAIVTAVLMSLSVSLSATTYYVSNSGSDSNDGKTETTAWKTISKINSISFTAGDVISFKCGDTWRETLNVPSSGTSASSITFNSYGTGTHPRILGSTQAITWTETATGSNKWKSSTAFTSNPYSVYTCEIFFENADGTKAWGTYVSGTSGLAAEYNWTWVSNYIYVYSTSDPGSKYTSVEVPQRESAINTNRKNYISFNGIDIFYTYWSGYGYDMSHYDMAEQFGLTIENSEIGYIGAWDEDIEQGYGIESVYSNMTVRNNKIHDCGRRGFAMDIYGSGFTAQNILVELNEFYGGFHTTGCDIDVGAGYTGNLNNVVIRRNYFHEPSKAYSADLSNMIFIQNNNTSSCTLSNIYIYNNIFKWQNGYGILMEGAQSVYIYNNTFYDKTTACPSWASFVSVQSNSHATVENNVFYSGSSTSGLENATNYVTNDYNLYYNSTISSGTETHGVFSKNPLFTSATDYSLQSASPAIGTGIPISVVTTDYVNTSRSTTTPSIGAYEYTGTVTTPAVPVYSGSAIENAAPTKLVMTYTLSLASTTPATSAFTVMVNSASRTVSSVSVSGTSVTLTLSSVVVYGDVVTVAYTKPSSNYLQTSAGGQAATFTAKSVTNNVGAVSPVYVSSAIENAAPTKLVMTYSLTLSGTKPATSAFTVMVNSASRTVSSVSVSVTTVTLILSSAVVYGDVVTVAYTKPSSNYLQTSAGGQAATITAQSVTNNVNPVSPAFVSAVVENSTPKQIEMTYSISMDNIVPDASAFAVTINSVSVAISSVSISNKKVILILVNPVIYGDVVKVAYKEPATNPLQSVSGAKASSFTIEDVTNNCLDTSSDQNTSAADFSVYPNPAIDNITVSVNIDFTVTLQLKIYDITGRLCMMRNINAGETSSNFSINLRTGLYIVHIVMGRTTLFAQKLVVNSR